MLKRFDSKDTKGRRKGYDEDMLVHDMDVFQSDFLKILQSKAYRRLAWKTQVLCSPQNPHIRTRSVHTNEVISISTVISEKLGLNTNLCQAIAAGHDLGHTPYGHLGEKVLSDIAGKPLKHPAFGVVVAQEIERKGYGLNLAYETLEGMLLHSRGDRELKVEDKKPQEYNVVMYADKIAYTFSDLNDALRYNYLRQGDVPKYLSEIGSTQRKRNDSCIRALIKESEEKGQVSFSKGREFEIFNELRDFMYKKVYFKIDWSLHKGILKSIHNYFNSEFDADPVIMTALLTDMEANQMGNLFLATRKPELKSIKHFGVFEILPYLKGRDIDYTQPKMDWGKNK